MGGETKRVRRFKQVSALLGPIFRLFIQCKEHHSYICVYQPEKSAVAECSISMSNCINCSGTLGYLDCFVKEVVEICVNACSSNGDIGFILGQAWCPITSMLMNKKQDQAVQVLDSTC